MGRSGFQNQNDAVRFRGPSPNMSQQPRVLSEDGMVEMNALHNEMEGGVAAAVLAAQNTLLQITIQNIMDIQK